VIRTAVFAVVVLFSSYALALGSPQTDEPSPETPSVTRVSTLVEVLDPKARVPRDITAESFTVLEDGQPRRVLGVEPAVGESWKFVLYFDRVLSSSRTIRAAAGSLAEFILPMVGMGTVEVVVAEPSPRVLVPATRDSKALDEALSQLFLVGEGRDDLRVARQRFLEEVRRKDAPDAEPAAEVAQEAVEDEAGLVRRQLARLMAHLAAKESGGDRVLFLVSDGFDLDPRGFYLAEVPQQPQQPQRETAPGLAEALAGQVLDKDSLELARGVSALGWTAYALPLGDDKLPEVRRFGPGGGGVRGVFGKPRNPEPQAPPPPPLPSLSAPREPLRSLTEAAGGEVLATRAAVQEAFSRLRSRVRLSYETPNVTAGPSRGVEVGATNLDWTVRSRRWESPGPLEEIAALRARELLAGEEDMGDLQIAAELRSEIDPSGGLQERLEVRLESGSPPAPGSRWRLSIAQPVAGGRTEVRHRIVTAADLTAEEQGWSYQEAIPAPGGERLAVLVEDLDEGLWGGDVALPQRAESAEALAPGPEVAAPEQRAPLDSGFGVRLIAPTAGKGMVPVEAEVRLPPGRRVERVELFWNEELADTLYVPPFKSRVRVPPDRPEGYLRVIARLDDGSTVEDALAMNSASVTDRLDVRLVELLVVVTDRSGKPVRGLTRDRFKVRKAGIEQEIASFEDAGRMPLTLALTIDSSASMFIKMDRVRTAAASLLDKELSSQDSALLIDFDTQPRLVAGVTRDLRSVSSALDLLSADGGSGLWEAIAFSVEQLQDVKGRKALVVYSDGVGEGESFSHRTSLRRARASGIPVYLIVTNALAASRKPVGSLRSYTAKIRDLAEATGGKAYFVSPEADLGEAYNEILAELRSQYTVAFYPREGSTSASDVRVEVEGKGLTTRTVSGGLTR